MSTLRAYMASGPEPQEGAILVFARTMREAKPLAFTALAGMMLVDEWTDMRLRWLRGGADWHRVLDREADGVPYAIESPASCRSCAHWYEAGLSKAGLCADCAWDAAVDATA